MPRFDVYASSSRVARLVLDVQSNHLSGLDTRVVVPLFPEGAVAKPATVLNPVVDVDGERFTMFTQFMASVPKRDLKQLVTSLGNSHDEVVRAVDMLLTGF